MAEVTYYQAKMIGLQSRMKEQLSNIEGIESQLSNSLNDAKKRDGWQNCGVIKKADNDLNQIANDIANKKNKILGICTENVTTARKVDEENALEVLKSYSPGNNPKK